MKKTSNPKPPSDLDGEALAEWHRVCAELLKLGTLDATDRSILVQYCRQWAAFTNAHLKLKSEGSVITYPNGVDGVSPHYKIAKESGTALHKLTTDLGLTPAARAKAKQPEIEPPELKF